MTVWRMSFRQCNQGYEMWPTCYKNEVAAISYDILDETNLSKFKERSPAELWQQLKSSQSSSLAHVAYHMAKGDTIFVKKGPDIVGKGKVLGSYKYRLSKRVLDEDDYLWPHQVPVKWDASFIPFRLVLGAYQHTVLLLSPERIRKIQAAASKISSDEKSLEAEEGRERQRMVTFRERNRALIEAKKRTSTGQCEVCLQNLKVIYRLPNIGCLHAHHIKPYAENKGVRVTSINDLILMCPNCHAAAHSFKPVLTPQQLSKRIAAPNK